MAKNKTSKPNRLIAPSYQWKRIQVAEAFNFGGEIITSRYLMGFIVEHINDTQGKKLTVEQFRIKDYGSDNKTADTAPAEPTPPAEAA